MSCIKNLFCKHKYTTIIKWRYWHGPNGNDPASIIYLVKCNNCGKTTWLEAEKGSDIEKDLLQHKEMYDD